MPTRPLSSRCDLPITPVVFGAMWHRLRGDDAARIRCVHEALDLGITSIDTAPLYDFGGSERLLGKALAGRWTQVQLLTKVGLSWDDDHGEVLFRAQVNDRPVCVRRDSRPASVRRDVEASLTRLGTDRLDLVQVHQLDPQVPVAETMGELARLREEGKLAHIGVSNYPPEELQAAAEALGDVPLASSQEPYNLLERGIEQRVLPAVRRLNAGLLCYSPLAQGLLAGALLKLPTLRWPARGPLFVPSNVQAIHGAVREALQPIAAGHGVSLAAVALAWLLAEPGVSGVIAGASRSEQLRENAEAVSLTLSNEERRLIRARFEALRINHSAGKPLWQRGRRLAGRVARAGLRRLRR